MKTLPFDKAKLEQIVEQYPTPFHIYDEKAIIDNINRLKAAFSWNKGYHEYFAVKATPNPAILYVLKQLGCGMDCSSYTELMMSAAVGIVGDNIMFSSNATPAQDFLLARKLNATINLDDITHIDFLAKNGGIPEKICLRYNPGGDFKLGNTIMGSPGESKYGMTRPQIFEAVERLKALGVKEFGVHAFLASNMTDEAYYPALAREMFSLARDIHVTLGVNVGFVNLSGGIGIPYLPDEKAVDIERVGASVKAVYDEIVPDDMEIKLYTELGRYVTGPYGYLVTTAVHKKNIYKDYIGLDACAANLMRPAMYGSYHHITVAGKENAPKTHVYDITGSLCENNDKFAISREMPEIEIGDLLVIHDTGAHGFSMGYNYNGKLRSAEIMLKADGSTALIRRAETPDDYFATFDFMGLFKN